MGRYTLILETDLEGRRIIEVGGAKKTSLKRIDLETTKARSKEELCNLLDLDINGDEYDFYITYRQDGREKVLPVAYENKKKLAYTRMTSESVVNTEDIYFNQIVKTFLKAIKKPMYLDILREDKVLIAKVEQYVNIWKYQDQSNFTRDKLAYHMSTYKQLRDIIFSFEKYNEICKQKRR